MRLRCLQIEEKSSQEIVASTIDRLGEQIRLIDQRIEIAVHSSQDSDSISSHERTEREQMVHSLKHLARTAKSFHASTSSVLGGGRSTPYHGSQFEGSVTGHPLTEEQHDNVKNWIPPPEITEEDYRTPCWR
jgi:hypothetical protein